MPMWSQPGIWVISSSRPRAPARMVTMRKADEDMAGLLAAEQARAREAHEHLAEATAAHAVEAQRGSGQRAELERMRQDAEAGPAVREPDHIRAERAELGRA